MGIPIRLTSFLNKYPECYMILASTFLAVFTATGKSSIPLLIIVFLRFLIPLLILNVTKIHNFNTILTTIKATNLISLMRTFFVVISQYTFFYCVKETSLFDANTLLNTAPIFILIIYFFYNSSFSINKSLGVILGFVGAVLILKPGHTLPNLALLAGLCAGFCWGMSNFLQSLMLKKYSNEQCMFYYYFYGTVTSFVVSIYSLKISWLFTGMNLVNFLIIVLFSIATISFQYFTGKAYKLKSAYELSPYLYLTILFSWFIDLLVFRHVSPISSVMGSFLIFMGVMISRRSPIALFCLKGNQN